MQSIGIKDGVEKAEVTANGVPVSGVQAVYQVGQIATCSFTTLPENIEGFNSPDQEVVILAKGKSAQGEIFRGYVTGTNFSNMTGNIQAGVNLVHRARDLDETNCIMPGVVAGSAADQKAIIYKGHGFDKSNTNRISIKIPSGGDFGKALCEGIAKCVERVVVNSATSGFNQPTAGEKARATALLRSIESSTGPFPFSRLQQRVNVFLTSAITMGSSGSNIWDLLSGILSSFDLTLSCGPQGRVAIIPNFSGVKAQGMAVPTSIIQKFDQSSEMKRSPSEAIVVAKGVGSAGSTEVASAGAIGKATVPTPGSRGSLMLGAPGWLTGVKGDFLKNSKAEMDAFAKAMLIREISRLKTCNLICPVIPGAMPGSSMTFQHLSGVKGFNKGTIKAFNRTFDGYCWKVTHQIGTEGMNTVLHFQNVSDGNVEKQSSHPIWTGGKMPTWT